MRVGNNFLDCVVFLGCVKKNNFDVKGTAFLVKHDPGVPYLVTARHVVDAIEQHGSDDGHVYFRANRPDKGASIARLQANTWFRHEDDRVDVAVLPGHIGKPDWDHFHISTTHFLTNETLVSEQIGIGDDLFFPGLFSARVGESRNIPICRQGCIAAMPSERIPTKLGQIHGYLIEARSIGGLSGSPVFLSSGVSRGMAGVPMFKGPEKKLYLLGMIHGHYGMGGELTDLCSDTDFVGKERSVNMGIGIVCPASDIMAVLTQPEVVRHREEAIKAYEATEQAEGTAGPPES